MKLLNNASTQQIDSLTYNLIAGTKPDGKPVTFLSDVIDTLPHNCILNKVTTGCGLTSMALSNDVPTVIAVPFKSLLTSKAKWCADRNIDVAVYYGDKKTDLTTFTGKKILTTYDSLAALTKLINADQMTLLVDEYHLLLNHGTFRYGAIRGVLDTFKSYASYCFGSATPPPIAHELKQLKDIPRVNMVWSNVDTVNVKYTHCPKGLTKTVAAICVEHSKISTNAHIFINSVKGIGSILKYVPKDVEVRIVCADTKENQERVKTFGKGRNTISPITSDVAKINFYTSTVFEGCDIEDKDSKSYIVTDGTKDHTKIDVLTTMPQIIGRVRNSANKLNVELLYSANVYKDYSSKEAYALAIDLVLADMQNSINDYNNATSTNTKQALAKEFACNSYILQTDTGSYELNDIAKQCELSQYDTLHRTFYVNTYDGTKNGIQNDTTIGSLHFEETAQRSITGIVKHDLGLKASYKDLCIEYIATQDDAIAAIDDSIMNAYWILGAAKMEALKYRKKDIEAALTVANTFITDGAKIAKLLALYEGSWIKSADLKVKLQGIYDSLNITAKAKATDVDKYFVTTPKARKVNGVVENGFVIISKKF